MGKIGAVLKAVRVRAGYSQEEFSHLTNRSQACISKFENDRKVPDIYTFKDWLQLTNSQDVAIAFFCGVDAATILQQLTPIIGGIAIWFI